MKIIEEHDSPSKSPQGTTGRNAGEFASVDIASQQTPPPTNGEIRSRASRAMNMSGSSAAGLSRKEQRQRIATGGEVLGDGSVELMGLAPADLDWQSLRSPFCHPSGINNNSFQQRAGVFQSQRGELTIFAVSARTINHDFCGVQTGRQHGRKMLLGIVTIKLIRSRYVTLCVVSIVTSIDKHNQFQCVLWVMKKLHGLPAINRLQALLFQTRGHGFLGRLAGPIGGRGRSVEIGIRDLDFPTGSRAARKIIPRER